MKFSPPREWFGPREFGAGVEPKTWEGVLVVVAGVALVGCAALLIRRI